MLTSNYAQKASIQKTRFLRFESSMKPSQKAAFLAECAQLSKEIVSCWDRTVPSIENDILNACYTISPCIQPQDKSPLFLALEFRYKAKRMMNNNTQVLDTNKCKERIQLLNAESSKLCDALIEGSLTSNEDKVLQAIELIENTMKEIKIPHSVQKIEKIAPPKFYRYRQ